MNIIRYAVIDLGADTRVRLKARRCITCLVVFSGSGRVAAAAETHISLVEGDFLLNVHGQTQDLYTGSSVPSARPIYLNEPADTEEPQLLKFHGGGSLRALYCVFGIDQSLDGLNQAVIPDHLLYKHEQDPFPIYGDLSAFERGCRGLGARAFISASIHLMYIQTIRRAVGVSLASEAASIGDLGMPQIAGIRRLIDANPGADWTLETLARAAGMSRTVFCERFTEAVGEPPIRYVTRVRVDRAVTLLNRGLLVEQVASLVGYASPSSFSRTFKRYLGRAPHSVHRRTGG